MLYQFGPVQFQRWPLNTHEANRESTYDFAEHAVVGGIQPLEAVGEGQDDMVLVGRLFPHKIGGLSHLDALRRLGEAQAAQPLMRGDGKALGWRVIRHIGERGSYLDASGIGRLIEFEATFSRTARPSASSWYATLVSLFS